MSYKVGTLLIYIDNKYGNTIEVIKDVNNGRYKLMTVKSENQGFDEAECIDYPIKRVEELWISYSRYVLIQSLKNGI